MQRGQALPHLALTIAKKTLTTGAIERCPRAKATAQAGDRASRNADEQPISAPLRHWKLIVAISLFASTATYGALKIVPSSYKSTVEILLFDPQRQIDA